MDCIFLEIVAEGKVPQHLKKRMMPVRMTYIFKIVMLAAYAHAFLAGSCALIRSDFVSQKNIFELVHSCICKQECRITKGN
jgi:hypothetical protein